MLISQYEYDILVITLSLRGRYKQWNGLLEWKTGLDYWNGYLVTLNTLTQCTYSPNQVRAIAFAWEVHRYVCLLVCVSASQAINHSSEIKPG